jgi:AcrR family transcriptional regulator
MPEPSTPRGSNPPRSPEDRDAAHRARILAGLATALAEKGYAATTIADIAAAARVSRTTVYAQFAEKDQALIALYTDLGNRLLELLARALFAQDDAAPWRARVEELMGAYLDAMAAASAGERLSLLEIASAGPAARGARREVLERFSEAIHWMSAVFAADHDDAHELAGDLPVAIVGAINELVLRAAEDGPEAVRALRSVTAELIVRLMAVGPGDRA